MNNTGLFIIRADEAAATLNVSSEYLELLTANGKLSFHGTPGFYRLSDVLTYKTQRDADRRESLKELARMTQEFGGYGDED